MDNKKMNMPYANENMKPVANMPIYHHGHHHHHCGYGCGFTIIVVLFILLVIIGATVYYKDGDEC
ncbi:YjcZ family sporulation protein [Fictibacillus iocasae]|uniref:YjcZ family sporulation protein n=1 Tax=Fictibacillus iocasae TaxID=2715437 RepID=A0ABW2NJ22_9BACL